MRLQRDLAVAVGAVALAVIYFAFIPQEWYENYVPLWMRLTLGAILGVLWLWLFVCLPLLARIRRSRQPPLTPSSDCETALTVKLRRCLD